MTKNLIILFALFTLSGCLDSGSGGSDDADKSEAPTQPNSTFNPADFTLTQSTEFDGSGESQIRIELNNLASDDAIYITANSSEEENGRLKITPFKTILNPSNGSAQLVLQVRDLGLSAAPNVLVEVTSSSGSKMEQELVMEWGN